LLFSAKQKPSTRGNDPPGGPFTGSIIKIYGCPARAPFNIRYSENSLTTLFRNHVSGADFAYLKSEGRRSRRLHFSHSATFFILPFSKMVFILTSPPQEQKNFCVALAVREFLLAWAMLISLPFGV
jgi:hypothetical protein